MASLDSELEDNESTETPNIKLIHELEPSEPLHIPVLKDYQSDNKDAQPEQKAADIVESNLLVRNKCPPLSKLGKLILPLIVGGVLTLANLAKGEPSFEQFTYAHGGISPDSGYATLFKPDNTDSLVRKIGQFAPGYWLATTPISWGIVPGDSGIVRIQDPTGQTSWIKWFCRSTGFSLLPPAFPGSHNAISVRNVIENGIDSVDAKLFKKGGLDTLEGRFAVNDNYYYEIYFDGDALNLSDGDTVIIIATAAGKFGSTQGPIIHRFIDADTLPGFAMENVNINENIENKLKKYDGILVSPTPATNYLNVNKKGELYLYNSSGSLMKKVKGNRIYTNSLPSGAYFLFIKPEGDDKLILEPEKVVILK